jgi:hypothetical protein
MGSDRCSRRQRTDTKTTPYHFEASSLTCKWAPASRVHELEAKIKELTKEVEELKGLVESYKRDRGYFMDKYLERSRSEPEPQHAPVRPPPMTYQYDVGGRWFRGQPLPKRDHE